MELNDWEKILDLKLAATVKPVEEKMNYVADRFDRFTRNCQWVAAVIVIPLVFLILQKVF